jgi:AraC family transcriptional regulator, regulatory protein of adaptative response / methylated-DNA-[protein]-cysteine methyltransferase
MKQTPKTVVRYGGGQTLLGEAVVFATDKGVRALRLLGRETYAEVISEMGRQFAGAEMHEDEAAARRVFRQVDAWLAGKLPPAELSLDLRGTPFQTQVWRALLKVPHGTTCSYSELAQRVGKPRAVRAVANACGRNPVGLLVPCHRIVRNDGSLGGYYGGVEKKKRLLDHERATMRGE